MMVFRPRVNSTGMPRMNAPITQKAMITPVPIVQPAAIPLGSYDFCHFSFPQSAKLSQVAGAGKRPTGRKMARPFTVRWCLSTTRLSPYTICLRSRRKS